MIRIARFGRKGKEKRNLLLEYQRRIMYYYVRDKFPKPVKKLNLLLTQFFNYFNILKMEQTFLLASFCIFYIAYLVSVASLALAK